jgi:hypothetical protein
VTTAEEYPAYLDELEIGDERSARKRIEELRAEIDALTKSLEGARKAKRILHVAGDDLRIEVVRFLTQDLGLSVRTAEGDEGGLWLQGEDGRDWCIADVAESESGNATKEQLAATMLRRARSGGTGDVPALLVVNTYQSGRAIEDRDQPVGPDVVRRAAEDNVLVTRTVDLVRLGQRAAQGFPGGDQLTEALRGGGGWMEVDASLNATAHRAPAGSSLLAS